MQLCKELLKTGAIGPWDYKEPITVINGLGVAVDRVGKRKLILDARYINLFDEYHSFSYESLADVPQYLKPDDFLMLTYLKSGYHQVKMPPLALGNVNSTDKFRLAPGDLHPLSL